MKQALTLLNEDLEKPRPASFELGEVAILSRRYPGGESLNEDSGLVASHGVNLVLAVADGAGGGLEGDKASRLTIETILEHWESDGAAPRAAILDAFEDSNRRVLALGTGAATTLSVVELHAQEGSLQLRAYHAGDSSVLVTGARGRVKLNTIPHSPVGYGVEAGLISPQDALHHDDLNLVSNLIGINDMRVEMGSALTLSALDTVVLGSDGLFDNLQLEEIVETVRKGPLLAAANKLADLATRRMLSPQEGEPSKPDDLTFLLFRPARSAKRESSVAPGR